MLCDLASTAYYIGGIVESQIGKAAPWFILAVMLFSYAVRSVYIESCSMFVRGGVYRVVKEAMGGLAGQALGLGADVRLHPDRPDQRRLGRAVHHRPGRRRSLGHYSVTTRDPDGRWGSVAIAVGDHLYFCRENIRGIHESSDKALKIMAATTVMAVDHDRLVRPHARPPGRGTANTSRLPLPDRARRRSTPTGRPINDVTGKPASTRSGFLGRTAARPRRSATRRRSTGSA